MKSFFNVINKNCTFLLKNIKNVNFINIKTEVNFFIFSASDIFSSTALINFFESFISISLCSLFYPSSDTILSISSVGFLELSLADGLLYAEADTRTDLFLGVVFFSDIFVGFDMGSFWRFSDVNRLASSL